MSEAIKIVLVDDHEIIRSGIRFLLESEPELVVIGEASNGIEALEKVKELQPDLLIIDIQMPVLNGIDTIARMVSDKEINTKAIVLSMHDDEQYIIKSIECGASGYLLKDSGKQEFLKAIKSVHGGQKYFSGDISNILVSHYLNSSKGSIRATGAGFGQPLNPAARVDTFNLTKRELQILSLLYNGHNNKDIATQLDKSIRTIETHRFHIMKKMQVSNVMELFRKVDEFPDFKEFLKSAL